MRRYNKNLWSFDLHDPKAIPNARVALALLQCVRRSGTVFATNYWDDLGAVLAPAFQKHPKALKNALLAHSRDQVAAGRSPCMESDCDKPLFLNDEMLTALGEGVSRDLPRFRTLVDKAQLSLEVFVAQHIFPGDANLEMLMRLSGLTAPEAALLRLATACCLSSINRSLFSFIDSPSRITRALEILFDVRAGGATRILSGQGLIARCGLLEALNGRTSRLELDDLLCLSSVGERLLSVPFEDEDAMARAVLSPMAPQTSVRLAWPHLERQRALLKTALQGALDRQEHGVNILLYGAPGTGKTEFVRQLIAEMGAGAFAVSDTDANGGEASRQERLAHLQLSQCFVGRTSRSIVVLDEAEDIFQSDYQNPFAALFKTRNEGKAWINGLLEKNAAPVVWISNRISQLDPAYLRRFACCLEFPATPYSLRRTIAHARLGPLRCDDETMEYAASLPEVTPAHLDVAARFAGLGQAVGPEADAAVRFVIESHLKASGKNVPAISPPRATRFDMRYLNVVGNATPQAVMRSLARMNPGNGPGTGSALLFSGPPGTGKTQLAAEIAIKLGLRLVVRTASDINSKWYGESEGNVARMFRDCDSKTELLFLDEAETLLGSRDGDGHRADRAVTSEFLRWLEVFEGIFVCATNHAEVFDAALMRRFTFRMNFEPLMEQQRVELYAELVHGWQPGGGVASSMLSSLELRRLGRLNRLTPGDFANAARRVRALELPKDSLAKELDAEHQSKQGAKLSKIGFI